ncbi:MAG: VanZ family protein [Bacilli bacterium]|nr:VanZ family protein [Bacilli bacterium]
MVKKTIKLLLVLLTMITIFYLSNDNGDKSTKKSDSVIIKISEKILNKKLTTKEKQKIIDKYVVIVRKIAHFTLYFLLGLFFISFLNEFDIDNKKIILSTIIFVFIYACTDELHQLFIDGRSGEILDILIDTLGGITSTLIYTKFKIRRRLHE